MSSRSDRKEQDQRRTADRRASVRVSGSRGRRATDAAPDPRIPASGDRFPVSARKRRSTSDGREPLVVYLRPEAIRARKMAALERDTTVSAIIAVQADAWLRAQGRPTRR